MISGETPIALDWSYNFPGLISDIEDAGYEFELNFPSDGVYGGFYAQGVVKDSPHPALLEAVDRAHPERRGRRSATSRAARCRPGSPSSRRPALITDDMKGNLPRADILEQVSFLTADQTAAANEVLLANWGPMVADA